MIRLKGSFMLNNKILIIDDEEIVIDSIRLDLKNEDYNIITAANGKSGLDVLKKEQPMLIILDLKMPVMDGIEFLEHLKVEATDPYSIIVLTGHGDNEDIKKCFRLGVNSFLRKPYNVYELRGLVENSFIQKQTQLKLYESNDNLQRATVSKLYLDSILENMLNSLVVVSPDGYIKTVNHATLDLLGYKESELLNQPIDVIFSKEVSNKRPGIDDLMQKGFIRSAEISYMSKNGSMIPVLFSGSVMQNEQGDAQGIVCVASDITELKRLEKKLKIEKQNVEKANQAKTEFLSKVRHDLRTPLNAILGFGQLLEANLEGSSNVRQSNYVKSILKSGKYLSDIINQIVDLTHIEDGKLEMDIEKTD